MSASFESSIEGDLQTEKQAEIEGATIWFRIHGLLERMQQMLTRRHSGDRGPDPDYASGLQDLENLEKLIRLARETPDIRINNSKGNGGNSSWQNKVLVGVAITVIATAILEAIATYALVGSLRTKIEDYITSNDRRMDRDESQWDATQRRLDRGAGAP